MSNPLGAQQDSIIYVTIRRIAIAKRLPSMQDKWDIDTFFSLSLSKPK